jgi:sulfur-carrier protein
VRVRFFGKLADSIGRELELDGEGLTVEALRSRLATRFPPLAADLLRPALRACIGDEIVSDDRVVAPGEIVELFPPLSGG